MMINLNWTQLTAGTLVPILEPASDIDYTQDNWLMHIQEFLIRIRGKVFLKNAWCPTPTRDQDFMLMEDIDGLDLCRQERHIINNWQLFFQVSSCADISNASGEK